jgi:hypothetical protein
VQQERRGGGREGRGDGGGWAGAVTFEVCTSCYTQLEGCVGGGGKEEEGKRDLGCGCFGQLQCQHHPTPPGHSTPWYAVTVQRGHWCLVYKPTRWKLVVTLSENFHPA